MLVGDDPGSHSYVRAKHRDCAKVGITSIRRELPADASQADVEGVVDELNADPACTGYIVQLPAAEGARRRRGRWSGSTRPRTPTACTRSTSAGWCSASPAPLPCTPRGIVELCSRYDVPLAGARGRPCVGRGVTVGRPLGLLLTRRSENATVTLCHTGTRDLAAEVRRADIVVAAAGVPGLITADMVRPGAAVLDVGVTRTDRRARRRRRARGRRGGRAGSRRCPAGWAR